MILKRLKLFTAGLPGTPGYTFSNYDSVMNNNNNAANTNSGGTNVSTTNGASTGTAATNSGTNTASVNNAGGSSAGNASAATNTGANAANSGSVMQKQSYDKPNVSTNNVNSNTAQAYNKEQLDNLNKAHKQELNNRYAQGAKRGEQAGMRKAGIWQGLKNTWRNAGTMKKIGMGGAALAGTYFLGKGLLGGNNNNNNQQ
jgi:hypothetical protein